MCECQESLVGYIYDEISAAERREVEAHLAVCAECRSEVEGLRSTRTHLALWAPPEPDLGFRLIRGGAEPAPALPRRRSFAPAFAFAAAAVIVLAVAAAIANVEIRYDDSGLMVRTGWASPQTVTASAEAVSPVRTEAASTPGGDFAVVHARLDELEAALSRLPASTPGAPAEPGRMSDADLLRQVRAIVREAEQRQEGLLARRLMQVMTDFDRQRQVDFAAIRQNLGEYQGLTNVEIQNQMNRFLRVATGQDK